MDEDIRNALVDLKESIDRQTKVQEDANTLMRRLIQVTAENAQELLELRKAQAKG